MTIHHARLQALGEVKSGTVDQETWLKAFAHSDGQRESTVAHYVLFRSERLVAAARIAALKQRVAVASVASRSFVSYLIYIAAIAALIFVSAGGALIIIVVSFLSSESVDAHPALILPFAVFIGTLAIPFVVWSRYLWRQVERLRTRPPMLK